MATGQLHAVAWAANTTAVSGDVPAATLADEHPRLCWAVRWGGFFGSLRNMLGVQNLCTAFFDQLRLVEE